MNFWQLKRESSPGAAKKLKSIQNHQLDINIDKILATQKKKLPEM
jgi:hypothetical protein